MQTAQTEKPVKILLVEDNPSDAVLTQRTLKEAKFPHELIIAHSGEEAVAILRQEEKFKNVALPDVILLDLNLPKMGGHQVLEIIKHSAELKTIPVYLLTSSKDMEDIDKGYELYIKSYIAKPITLDSLQAVNFFGSDTE